MASITHISLLTDLCMLHRVVGGRKEKDRGLAPKKGIVLLDCRNGFQMNQFLSIRTVLPSFRLFHNHSFF